MGVFSCRKQTHFSNRHISLSPDTELPDQPKVCVVCETVQSVAHRNSLQLICFPSFTHELHCSVIILSPSAISSAPLGQQCHLLSIPTGVISVHTLPPCLLAKTLLSNCTHPVCWFVCLFCCCFMHHLAHWVQCSILDVGMKGTTTA